MDRMDRVVAATGHRATPWPCSQRAVAVPGEIPHAIPRSATLVGVSAISPTRTPLLEAGFSCLALLNQSTWIILIHPSSTRLVSSQPIDLNLNATHHQKRPRRRPATTSPVTAHHHAAYSRGMSIPPRGSGLVPTDLCLVRFESAFGQSQSP